MEAWVKGKSRIRRRNWVARAVKRLRPKVMRPKRGKGSYRRKGRHSPPAGRPDDETSSKGSR
jgi:stalled ribosome alternative rescue factor ArfA